MLWCAQSSVNLQIIPTFLYFPNKRPPSLSLSPSNPQLLSLICSFSPFPSPVQLHPHSNSILFPRNTPASEYIACRIFPYFHINPSSQMRRRPRKQNELKHAESRAFSKERRSWIWRKNWGKLDFFDSKRVSFNLSRFTSAITLYLFMVGCTVRTNKSFEALLSLAVSSFRTSVSNLP